MSTPSAKGPRAVSASQIETWHGCRRKWAWRNVARIEAPPHASAALGSRIHKQLELYLTGEPFDYSTPVMRAAAEMAIPSIANLPPPKSPGMLVETPFNFDLRDGSVLFRGIIDVLLPDGGVVPGCEAGSPIVVDHKSTKSRRYIKSVETLTTDVQAMIYAYHAMTIFRVNAVQLLWNYCFTAGAPATERRHLKVLQPQVVDQFLGPISAAAAEITTTYAAQPNPLELPPSTEHCDAYGGCPYKLHCTDLNAGPLGHLTPDEDLNMTSAMDLFANLTAQNNADDAKAAAAPPAPMPGITDVPAGFAMPAWLAAPAPTPAVVATVASPIVAPTDIKVAINPPESLLPPPPAAPDPVSNEATPAAKRKRRTKAEMAADEADAKAGKAALAEFKASGEAPISFDDIQIDGTTYTAEPATIPAPAFKFTPNPLGNQGNTNPIISPKEEFEELVSGFTLYVDCAPENTAVVRASSFYELVNNELAKANPGITTYKQIKYDGGGLFVAGFLKAFDASPCDLVLDTRTPEGLLVLESLRARATTVIS